MRNDEIVHVLYVARGRLALSEYIARQAALNEVQQGVTRQDVPLLTWTLVSSQKAAFLAARQQAPGVAVVEFVQLKGRLAFCAQLAHRWPSARMIAVTNELLEKTTVSFERCIPLPMSPVMLQNAIGEMMRTGANGYLSQAGDVSLDLHNRTVITPRGEHHMTPKQCSLLHMLMERRNEVVSRLEIMQEIWQTNFLGDTRTLDVHIRWLRERIERDPSNPQYLLTVRGKGYRFRTE
ncbi:MAG: winged helix-turn-helix transcriptional regulator [Anaerolineales bacterium]|nr:winged helix-turn-helix transcriptional regulator [Anaerolineales bacterium]